MKKVNSLEKKFVQPLENFTNYDFLEMHEARKKLNGTAADYDAMRQKIEVSLTGQTKKRIGKKKETYDPVQLSMVLSLFWIFIFFPYLFFFLCK